MSDPSPQLDTRCPGATLTEAVAPLPTILLTMTAGNGQPHRIISKMDVMRWANVWREAARHRVCDERGAILIVVEMAEDDSASQAAKRLRRPGFYFLLDGQDVMRASDDTFVNLTTGEILARADG